MGLAGTLAGKTLQTFYAARWPKAAVWLRQTRQCAIEEAREFLINEKLVSPDKSIEELGQSWSSLSETLWRQVSPEEFYLSWTGEVGAANIVANIEDQLSRPYLASALENHLSNFQGKILDFGCGTATLSLAWQKNFAPKARLMLADLENLARRFAQWRVLRRPEYAIELVDTTLETIPAGSLDAILCIDVFEHLSNPSEIFAQIEPKLKVGGKLFLQAPWGGHLEHLAEAPLDWSRNGGHDRLMSNYRKLEQMKPFCKLSGVFVKSR